MYYELVRNYFNRY